MTPSPSASPKSPDSSSRPSSSESNSPFHDTPTPRSSLHSDPHPSFQQFTSLHSNIMGAAGPGSAPGVSDTYASSSERPRLQKQKSDESIRPTSSTSSPQGMEEEAATGADYDAGTSGSPPSEHRPLRQKKKRTRTLTTPHQSAVLHALLAQSRFPTTAMRQEVGRSIGLSARKVQVWFQNQRQKARKPRNEGTTPLSRPPQFGAFQSGSQNEPAPVAGPSGTSPSFQVENTPSVHPHQAYSAEHHPVLMHPSGLPAPYPGLSQFSLPDVARQPSPQNTSRVPQPYQYPSVGYNVEPGTSSTVRSGAMTRSFTPPFAFAPPPPPPSQGLPYGSQAPYPHDPYDRRSLQGPTSTITRDFEPPIVLPPLRFDQPRGIQTLPPPPIHRTESQYALDTPRSAPHSAHSTSTPSISPGSASSHFPSSLTLPPPPSRRPESIPPPFTLQPPPQWGSSPPGPGPGPALSPPPGLSQSSHTSPAVRTRLHRTNSDPTRRLPPLSMLLDPGPSREPQITQPWSQASLPSTVSGGGRRFDPVHSVLREGEHAGGRLTGDGSRRNRHTYDFTMHSGSVVTPSPPPNPDDSHDDLHRQSDQTRG